MTLLNTLLLIDSRKFNSDILQGTAAFFTLKDSGVLHSVWTQLTFCKCAIDQYYCYCKLTEHLLKKLCLR